jgi:hypothetical protein
VTSVVGTVLPDPSLVPGGEHSVQAVPTRLQADNKIPVRKITMRSALGNDIIYYGLSDVGQRKRRGFLLAGESVTLTYPAMTPETIWLYGTAGDVVLWDTNQI